MKKLIGKKVLEVLINDGDDILVFHTDEGSVGYTTDADCCSESWFSDVLGLEALLDQTVLEIEETELDDPDNGRRSRQEEDDVLRIRLKTTGGEATIMFRNSSNGYYGGGYGPMGSGWKEEKLVLKKLTEDYTA